MSERQQARLPLVPTVRATYASLPRLPSPAALMAPGETLVLELHAAGHVDVGTLDALARVALEVRRCGGRLEVRGACEELHELAALVGLGALCELHPNTGAP